MAYSRDMLETNPIDHTKFNSIATQVRNVRVDINERLKNMFSGFISGENQTAEGIKKLPFYVQASDPDATADKIKLYGKDVNSIVELFVKDENGLVKQLVGFRSGDILMSSNTTIPNGFSDVSATYENKFIRISSGIPLETGGADTHNHGGSSGGTILTISQIPSHSHSIQSGQPSGANNVLYRLGMSNGSINSDLNTGATGGAGSHSHSILTVSNVPAYIKLRCYSKD